MSHFEIKQFKIKDEDQDPGKIRVVKLDNDSEPQVKAFSMPELRTQGKGEYGAVKAKYGALAVTDRERSARTMQNSRFVVNPLLRDPLAIEEEEQRVIRSQVEAQLAELREQARSEAEKRGYDTGLKNGRDDAYAEFREKAGGSLKSFEEFVSGCEALKAEIFKANERFLMEMIFQVAKMVVLKELSTDSDYVLRLARDLIDRIGIRENVKIRINPKDVQSIETLKSELVKQFGDLKNLGVEVSDEVAGGGCKIETQWSAIDASIETQLKGLQEALTGSKE